MVSIDVRSGQPGDEKAWGCRIEMLLWWSSKAFGGESPSCCFQHEGDFLQDKENPLKLAL
jgi:hypothetical protein